MSPKRWIFVGLTLASAIAFVVDRVFMGEPHTASAETMNDSSSASSTPVAKTAAPAAAAAPSAPPVELQDPSLAYLNKLEDAKFQRNVFMPSAAMIMHYRQKQAAEQEHTTQKEEQPDSAKEFAAAYKLEGTFCGPDGSMAVVDGNVLLIGDELDGFELTRILPYAAEFQRGTERVTLDIPLPKVQDEGKDKKSKSKVKRRN